MKTISLIFTFLITISSTVFSRTIITECNSERGSIYNIKLNTDLLNGEIRYRWMGQDVHYKVGISSYNQKEIVGTATFDKAASGETRGTPIYFRYNIVNNVFYDKPVTAEKPLKAICK